MPASQPRRPSPMARFSRYAASTMLAALLAACEGDGATAPAANLGVANGPNGNNAVVRITPQSDTLDALSDMLQLTTNASAPTWVSLTPDVASVDAEGRVVSVGTGLGLIQAVVGRKADTAEVLVRQIPASLQVTPDAITVAFPETGTLTAVVADRKGFPIADAQVTWTSDDPAIASVLDGVVSAVSDGLTIVRAAFAGLSDSAIVEALVAAPYP
jgi:uncharacterized protein YjdB